MALTLGLVPRGCRYALMSCIRRTVAYKKAAEYAVFFVMHEVCMLVWYP